MATTAPAPTTTAPVPAPVTAPVTATVTVPAAVVLAFARLLERAVMVMAEAPADVKVQTGQTLRG